MALIGNPIIAGNGGAGNGYGTCSTAAGTAAKVVPLANYNLQNGGMVSVKFTNGSTSTSMTLNINSKGAKPVQYKGSATLANDLIKAGDIVTFNYDGTNYNLLSIDRWGKEVSDVQSTLDTAVADIREDCEAMVSTAVNTWLETNITNPDSPPLDRSLTNNNAAAPADLVGDLKESIECHESASIRKDNAIKFTAPNGQYSNLGIYKDGNVIIANQTFSTDTHKFNLTGTLIKDAYNNTQAYYNNFPEAYVDDIPEFVIGHMYKINLYVLDGTYTLVNPNAQFCYLAFLKKSDSLIPPALINNSVFYCTEKPQAIFYALRAGTYNCKIAIEIVDITKELEIPDIGNNLLQIFDKITGLGDSLMAGYTAATNPITDSEIAKTRKANWPSYLGADISREITNLAIGDSSWKNWRYGTGNTDLSSADIDTNCYLVGLGVNDSVQGNTVGTSADIATDKANNADSVYGNADIVIRTLHGYNANAHIFVFTSPASKTNSDAINDAIRYIASLYDYVHCIDLDAEYRNDFRYGAVSIFLSDTTHYNPLGYRIIANYIAAAINSFMLSNYTLFAKVPYKF